VCSHLLFVFLFCLQEAGLPVNYTAYEKTIFVLEQQQQSSVCALVCGAQGLACAVTALLATTRIVF
jgi:hypothetical protein